MQLSPTGKRVLERRYLKKNNGIVAELPEDMFHRVASAIASAELTFRTNGAGRGHEEVAKQFYDLMTSLDFLPNSPTLINAGRELNQLAACFVLPIGDSIDSIFETVKHAALIHKSGGGTGFSFTRIRPKNSPVKSTGGIASGPVSFIQVFNAATEAIKQGGVRRGANMAVLDITHPDIEEFITAKHNPNCLQNFNISVALNTEFMEAVFQDTAYYLSFEGKKYGKRNARDTLKLIARQAWENGEPGIIFLDRINKTNPTPELGSIEATNPCGEQPLLPYESCNLGSINLANMVNNKDIDWDKLNKTVQIAVRFLDNVIDVGSYPLPLIATVTKGNRKIGLGVMGWANMLYKLFIPYDSVEALNLAEDVMSFIQRSADNASRDLALERGCFPNIPRSIFKHTVKRNATCTTIAPTGSLSLIANTSPGIEPVFALAYSKKALEGELYIAPNPVFEDYLHSSCKRDLITNVLEEVRATGSIQKCSLLPKEWKAVFKTAQEIAPQWHVKMQAAFQKYCDNAVSKTVNLAADSSPETVMDIFRQAYEEGCKGITIFRSKSRREEAVLPGVKNNC